ncbi:MAG: PfkB family carbohydrate kinase [Dongiaceae bacterium]
MITVFGSINIDLIVAVEALPRPGETVLGPGYRLAPGGKGANQALAAARAGAAVRMVGAVGEDDFAARALADLKDAAVDLSQVARVAEPTGAAMICVDARGENMIVVASGANRRVAAGQLGDPLLAVPGLLLLQMEVAPEASWAVVERARARGWRILLNAAPAAPIPAAVLSRLDWLVVNGGEAMTVAAAAGLAAGDPIAAARAIAAAAGIACIVTLGGDGAAAAADGALWRVGALPITPVDTVGAGDAFVGAFAATIDDGGALPEALHRAAVAGGLACLTPGAQPSLPSAAAIAARRADLVAPRRVAG